MLIDAKTLEELRDLQLQKRTSQLPNANINPDSMIYMDAQVVAEVLYLIQQDAVTLTNNAFLAYASGDELSNLGLDRGIARQSAVKATGTVRFARDTLGTTNYVIPSGTMVSTQPSTIDGSVITYITTALGTIYGSIDAPTGIANTIVSSGGTITAGTYIYAVTAVDGNGQETDTVGTTTAVVASGTTNSISVTRTTVPNAITYNIYINTGSGLKLLDNATVTNYLDTVGATSSVIVPPVTNNTGSLYTDVAIECTI
jgi:uncharacterized phage protein gp47/JayE